MARYKRLQTRLGPFREIPPKRLLNVDVQSGAATGTSQTGVLSTLVWTHVVGSGASRMLVVDIALVNALGQTVSSVASNLSGSFTSLDAQSNGSACRVERWYLLAPATGTHTITVTLSANAVAAAGAQSWYGVDQTTPWNTVSKATGSSTTPSVAPASTPDEVVMDAVASVAATLTVGSPQAQRWNAGVSGIAGASSTLDGHPTTTTMSWTSSGSAAWAILSAGVNYAMAAQGATATPSTVATVASVPAPTVTAAAIASPSAVGAVVAVPAPSATADAVVGVGSVDGLTAIPLPAVTADAIVTPTTVAAVASVASPAEIADALVSVAPVPAVAGVGSPIVTADANTGPAVVVVVGDVPAPVVAVGGSATATPLTIAGVAGIPAPILSGGATVPAGVLALGAFVPAPLTAGDANVMPSSVAALAAVAPSQVSLVTRDIDIEPVLQGRWSANGARRPMTVGAGAGRGWDVGGADH